MTPLEHESTFERHFEDFPDFLKKILAWRPDYLVPVAKKACKLLKTLPDINAFQKNPDLIKYRNYFKLTNAEIHNKRIAILDDATQYTSTLQEYRRYFESLGAIVRTFSFVGHEAVVEGVRWKEDPLAEISKSLSEPAYQEYILQQSYHLLTSGNHFDLDHLVFAVPMAEAQLDHFLEIIRRHGLLLFTDDHRVQTQARRFSLNDARFFGDVPFLSHPSVAFGPLRKIKFDFDAASKTLFFSPLVFPTWHFSRCDVGAGLFRDVPFTIPFAVPRTIDKKNEGALLRVYTNLYFVCAVSFAKAFAQHVLKPNGWADDVRLRHNDLDALLGFAATQKLIPQIMTFVSNDDRYDFAGDRWKEESLDHRKGKYSDFGQVIDDLKRGYEQKLEKKRSRIGVHYYFTYDHLFQRFRNQTALSEGLDYYCDFGIVVPETIIDRNNGRVVRACRAGEPKFDYDWLRNQVLIPLAIDLFVSKDSRAKGIDATLLNKVLANFIFDYPGEVYPQLHCLVGEPYLYGTFIRVYHPQRACRKPSLYESSRISDFYSWNDSKKAFFLKQPRKLANAARQVFDQHQEVPYSEIVTYFRFLARVYSIFKRSKRLKRHVDALNMFSICGEENHFLAHVLFNVTRALEDIGLTFAENKVETRKCLREARGQAEAAADKLDFCAFAEEAMKIVNEQFATDLEFARTAAKFQRIRKAFSPTFQPIYERLVRIVNLEIAIIDIRSLVETGNSSHLNSLRLRVQEQTLHEFGVAKHDDLVALLDDKTKYADVCGAIYAQLRQLHASLPRPEPFLMMRVHNAWLERARNIATNYVYRNDLSKLAVLYIDFTDMRSIPEPKEDMISKYYEIVEQSVKNRNGEILYGGSGGDDAFTIAFQEVAPALECAKDVKRDLSNDLFLSSDNRDVKFGMTFSMLEKEQKEAAVLDAWGQAKECCELKSPTFRNRGHLLVSALTVENLNRSSTFASQDAFAALGNEKLKDGSAVFSFVEITPLHCRA